jgi:predicted nucleic acid-binding protein
METSRRPGVVFDCNAFLQALANENSAAAKALDLFEQEAVALFISEPILREVFDVLTRAKIRRKLPRITNVRVRALLERSVRRTG